MKTNYKNDYQLVFSILSQHHHKTMLEQLSQYSVFQQLIATMLSSRTKDTTTIPLVKKLFEKYKTPQDFLNAKISVLEKELYGIGFYRVKARNIPQLSRMIIDKYQCIVPDTLEELTSLSGVGRKTANCMLNYAFHKPAIAVDVHVHRLSNRLGWVKTNTPEETELKLVKILPQELWISVNELLVDYGQRICLPRKPKCGECPVRKYCEFGKRDE
ncbi:endonuclease III [Candidatus Woesearchaeota archaeon]|nr:endonuclease III [Candidatus Woesearchaeota archaeon]